jgi:hypothetical protein
LDADVGQKSVGPPGTVSLKVLRGIEDLEPEALGTADALSFVGSITPEGHLLPIVTGVSALHEQAKQLGADFIVVDTSGLVSGIYGQILKYHKVEMLRPDWSSGQRGEELPPSGRSSGSRPRWCCWRPPERGAHHGGPAPRTVSGDARYFSVHASGSDPPFHAGAASAVRAGPAGPAAGRALRR